MSPFRREVTGNDEALILSGKRAVNDTHCLQDVEGKRQSGDFPVYAHRMVIG
jgi:hypothetical protein